MSKKTFGSCTVPIQQELRFGASRKTAASICCNNRHYAEYSGYFLSTSWIKEIRAFGDKPLTYYDPSTGKPLFEAPKGRGVEDFIQESIAHGWPSFRDAEVSLY